MKKCLLILASILSIISCVKTIDIDGINKDKRLYVFANIDNLKDSSRLYFGVSSLTQLERPNDLDLEIKFNGNIIKYSLTNSSHLVVATIPNLNFHGGESLSVKALADGKYRAECELTIPDAPHISSSSVNKNGLWSIDFTSNFKNNYYLVSRFAYNCEFKQSDSLPYSKYFTPSDIFGLVIKDDLKSKDDSDFSIDFSTGSNNTMPVFKGSEIRNGNVFNGMIYRDLGESYVSKNSYENIKSVEALGRICSIPLSTFYFLRKYENLQSPVDMFMGLLFDESTVFPSNVKYGIGIVNVYNFNVFPVELKLDDFKAIVSNFYNKNSILAPEKEPVNDNAGTEGSNSGPGTN